MDNYVGEIRIFAGAYAPENWKICDGSLLNVADYAALYSLIGTRWGGDGVRTFGLPNLVGCLPVGQGTGAKLSPRVFGQTGGADQVSLTADNLPAHSHAFNVATTAATTMKLGSGVMPAQLAGGDVRYQTTGSANQVTLAAQSIGSYGGATQHANDMPTLSMMYIIAVLGTYPTHP